MPKVAYCNTLKDKPEFKSIDNNLLVPAAYAFARTLDDELYDLVMREKVVLHKNGVAVHPDSWQTTKLEENDEVIITPVLGKSKLGAVLMIAVGAFFLGAGLFWGGVLGGGAATWWANMAVGLGASMILGGISNLLFRPTLPQLTPEVPDRETQTYNWSGIRTIARVDTPIPVIYGVHKVGGNIISIFTQSEGNDEYLYELLALGEGEIDGICTATNYNNICVTSDVTSASYFQPAIFLDDQPISQYTGVQWWYRTGVNASDISKDDYYPFAQNKIPHFDSARVQYNDGREITTGGVIYKTTKEVDMVGVQVRAPSIFTTSAGVPRATTVYYNIDYKRETDSTWNQYVAKEWTSTLEATWIRSDGLIRSMADENGTVDPLNNNLIHVTYVNSRKLYGDVAPSTLKVKIVRIWPRLKKGGIDFGRFESGEWVYWKWGWLPGWMYSWGWFGLKGYFTVDVEFTDTATGETFIRSGEFEISRGLIPTYDDEGIEQGSSYGPKEYLPPTIYAGAYAVTLGKNIKEGDTFTIKSEQTGSATADIPITGLSKTGLSNFTILDFNRLSGAVGKDVYQIRVKRKDEPSTDLTTSNNLYLNAVTEILQGKFIYPNTALLGLRIKASQQLSGNPPNITTIVRGLKVKVPDLEDASPSGNDIEFDKAYWNDNVSRWETVNGTEIYWNDTTSWRREYSNNSMLCVRDLLLAKRYGLGDYITATDLKTSGINSVIKSCHATYIPSTEDYLKWWDSGNKDVFDRNISVKSSGTIDVNGSLAEINATGAIRYDIITKLNNAMDKDESYQYSITCHTLTPNSKISVYMTDNARMFYDRWDSIGSLPNKGSGTHTYTFDTNIGGYSVVKTVIENYNNASNINATITDMSLTRTSDKKLHYHTWNGVLDNKQSAMTTIAEMCNAFRTWPIWYDGTINFVLDSDTTPIHTLTVSNVSEFKQSFIPLSDIPYRLIGQFTNEDEGYEMQNMIAVSSREDLTKLNEKTIGLKGITNRKRAQRELTFKLNKTTNCTHQVNIRCGLDMLHAVAGDIIFVQNDLPSWGEGGRVVDYDSTNKTLTLTDDVTIEDVTATYVIRYQTVDNDFVTATINTTGMSNGDTVRAVTLVGWPSNNPKADAVYAFGKTGSYTKRFRILSSIRSEENEVEINALEHIPSIYSGEPTIEIHQDESPSQPIQSERVKPQPPINISVTPISYSEGIGFYLYAQPADEPLTVREIIVEMKLTSDPPEAFNQVATIQPAEGSVKYFNDNLVSGESYDFRFISRTDYKYSDPVGMTAIYTRQSQIPTPVSGVRIRGVDPNSHVFNSKDVTIDWNPPDTGGQAGLQGYKVEVYHTSVEKSNLLRTVYVKNETFTYTFDNMMDDSDGVIYGTPSKKFIFSIYSISKDGIESAGKNFDCYNTVPSNIKELEASYRVGGVKFMWKKSEEADHKNYLYKVKVGDEAWSSPANIEDNTYSRVLTATEIDTYGKRATIQIGVKDKDWYDQLSATYVTVSASANIVSDYLFDIKFSKTSGVSGNVTSLLDGNRTSGGVTIV